MANAWPSESQSGKFRGSVLRSASVSADAPPFPAPLGQFAHLPFPVRPPRPPADSSKTQSQKPQKYFHRSLSATYKPPAPSYSPPHRPSPATLKSDTPCAATAQPQQFSCWPTSVATEVVMNSRQPLKRLRVDQRRRGTLEPVS